MTFGHVALPPGADPAGLRRAVATAHEAFLTTGWPTGPLRGVVRDSWQRSRILGVDPDAAAPPDHIAGAELRAYRREHPLAAVLPVIRRLLVETAREDDQVAAVGDRSGRLLWVEGSPALLARAERIGFAEGANWAEGAAGTNAPGTALALGQPVQIYASEHFNRSVQPWSCAAVPVRDPASGAVLGVLDLTGGDHIAAPHALSLVRATVAAVEAELRLLRVPGAAPPPEGAPARLEVLGRDQAAFSWAGGRCELSPRHSEILCLLARRPGGLTAEALAAQLRADEAAPVTVRAELSRIRRLLGPGLVASRPYRLTVPVSVDADEVGELIAQGALRRALDRYRGPLLPRSEAPGVVEARTDLECALRAVLRERADAELLVAWTARPEHADDVEMLQAARDALPPGSPRALLLDARLRRALW
ncbi:GAF domain-containing protein [Streptomyces profundus]|uniref:GAF domain-containing protein n=1 Tax=Streptomyces profundus TaxID=2867410 RepID=UPI001D1623C2|nr:GAF domain-containing protein [Streptomyces sp. MA3_2.13]UED87880.1 GAF domain-containing protein [Streptomyces sp. MA3_2.13]